MSKSALDAAHQQTEVLTAQQVQQRKEGVSDQIGLLAPVTGKVAARLAEVRPLQASGSDLLVCTAQLLTSPGQADHKQ